MKNNKKLWTKLAIALIVTSLVTFLCIVLCSFGMALCVCILIEICLGNISWYEDSIGIQTVRVLCGSIIGLVVFSVLLERQRKIAKNVGRIRKEHVMKYKVKFGYYTYSEFEVEADSEEEAISKAEMTTGYEQILANLQKYGDIEVNEIEEDEEEVWEDDTVQCPMCKLWMDAGDETGMFSYCPRCGAKL